MTNLLDTILANLDKVMLIVTTISALAIAVIQAWKRIKQEIASEARAELREATAPLIAIAEDKPQVLLNQLVNAPLLSAIETHSNEGKRNIVASALIEREPKLLKKLKLNDLLSVANFVSGFYQVVKPIIKGK